MRVAFAVLLFSCLLLRAQTPASTPEKSETPAKTATAPAVHATPHPPGVQDSEIGFAFSLPEDWQFVPPAPAPRVIVPYPKAVVAPKGDACVKVVLTARRGTPASALVVTALPFSCSGQSMTPDDIANLGAGATEGLKQTFDVADPVLGQYALGPFPVWIERAKGTPKGHPEDSYTLETACAILTKGAVCWTAMAADAATLQAFERAPVSLEGRSFAALVPADAFLPKP
ncbi:MAG: hypothetical protein WBP85_02840 [Terracidiphilus sp.]